MKKTFENDPLRDLTLLVDGREAFPEILRCISAAESSIRINMFIWRDDEIGNAVAAALLSAAERGVRVEVTVDRYGVVLEKAEESKRSFFHKKLTLSERVKIAALKALYPMPGSPRRAREVESELYLVLTRHPNVTLKCDDFRADHSKYYIFDGEILILGGINIEDKENGSDMQGRVYQDYMVKLDGARYVDAFLTKLSGGETAIDGISFGMNTKDITPHRFEMEARYLELIESAERELFITMAYFSPIPRFVRAILDAHRRGVRVRLLIPSHANFQSDTNRRTARLLLRESDGGIEIYLSPKMVHTKLIANEKTVSLGSTNITKKAFGQLSELNLFFERPESAFVTRLLENIEENHRISERVGDYRKIKYNRLLAFFEGFLV